MPACAVVTETDIALYLRGKEGNRTTYSEDRTEDLEKYGILVVGQDQDRPGTSKYFRVCVQEITSKAVVTTTSRVSLAVFLSW